MTFSNVLVFFIIDWFVVSGRLRVQQSEINRGCLLLMGVSIDTGAKSFGETGKLWSFSSIGFVFTL